MRLISQMVALGKYLVALAGNLNRQPVFFILYFLNRDHAFFRILHQIVIIAGNFRYVLVVFEF